MQIPTFPIFLSLGTRITYISQHTTIIRWLTNLKKRSNLVSLYFLFFWYEFPYLFFRWTTKEMQLLVRDMDDLTACFELMRWVSASRIWFYKRNLTVKHLSVFAKLHLSSSYRVVRFFFKCSCKSKFASNRWCKFKKNGVLCNSRCHSSGSCDNKWFLIYDFKYFHKALFF